MSGSADGREAPEEGSATMRLDARFHSDVLGRLSRVADHLHALRDELVTVCAVADRAVGEGCLLYTSPSPRDRQKSRMPSSA